MLQRDLRSAMIHRKTSSRSFLRQLGKCPFAQRRRFLMRQTIPRTALGLLSSLLLFISLGCAQSTASDPDLRFQAAYHEGLSFLRAGSFKAAQVSFSWLCGGGMQGAEILQNIGLAYLRISPKDSPPAGTTGADVVQRVGHAACLAARKQFDGAREEYHALERQFPKYPYLHYAVGRFWADMDDVPAAVAEFQQELRSQPNDINSRLEIAAAEYKLDSAAGLPYAEEAVKLNPHVPSAHYLLGLLYLDTDDFEKAIPELEKAQQALPKDAKIWFALGSAYARAGRKEDAARARAAFAQLNKESQNSSEVRH